MVKSQNVTSPERTMFKGQDGGRRGVLLYEKKHQCGVLIGGGILMAVYWNHLHKVYTRSSHE